jgi:hypothetical protein
MTKARKTSYLSIKQKREPKPSFNRNNYFLVLQLYHIVKPDSKETPRLPRSDFRRQALENKILKLQSKDSLPLGKRLLRIAALWF